MQINRRSKLVRFSYLIRPEGIPSRTTLCAFFWRTFVGMPILLATVLALLVYVGWSIYHYPLPWAGYTSVILLICGSFAFCDYLTNKVKHGNLGNSTFVQGVKTIKGKVCPIITFVDPPVPNDDINLSDYYSTEM